MIYLDNASTTKPLPSVVKAINNCLVDNWGNPSSIHDLGIKAKEIVNESRKSVALFIGVNPSEIIFTSGACESNSLAICGFLKCHNYKLVTSTIEHKSIINLFEYFNNDKSKVTVDKYGFINIEELENILKYSDKKCIVSIQYANNEIGTIQDIHEITKLVHKYNGILHTDATQIIPDRKIDVSDIDMLSFSGQKLGATKGIGVLYLRKNIQITPIIFGSQENTIRGGTENVPYIAGLKEAIDNIQYESSDMRNYFVDRVTSEIKDCFLIGATYDKRLNNNASICFRGIESESLLLLLNQKEIFVSAGSACNSTSLKPSYVLEAIGISKCDINSVLRFTFGVISKQEIDIVVDTIKEDVNILRKFTN